MTDQSATFGPGFSEAYAMLPDWVPTAAQMYLAHTEAGLPIRALARAAGCHASTILRQIRKIETKRDDPLVDRALKNLGSVHFKPHPQNAGTTKKETGHMSFEKKISSDEVFGEPLNTAQFDVETTRVLKRLCEKGALLAVAENMDKAVIVRQETNGAATRTGVVARNIAEAMALKEWITPDQAGKITRYKITTSGRNELDKRLEDEGATPDTGFAEQQSGFSTCPTKIDANGMMDEVDGRSRRPRYALAESPLTALARRKDRDGTPFLSHELVCAGEQLREDFELSQMGPRVAQNWDKFLTGGGSGNESIDSGVADAPARARVRVADALNHLGPGLGDVILRCCCYLEGLETAEKKLGWSARSGKIVLRIALIRLKRHYDETVGPGGPLIG